MKFLSSILFFIFLYTCTTQAQAPLFSSFPLTPITNYDQSSVNILLKCSSPIYVPINNQLTLLSKLDPSQITQWFMTNKPIEVITNTSEIIFPNFKSSTDFDILLAIQTPLASSQFIILVLENFFYNINKESVPYSSPLIITRGTSSNTSIPMINNNILDIKRYSQLKVKSWDTKSIDITLIDSSIRSDSSGSFLDINLLLPGSGKGTISIDGLIINKDGYEYGIEKFLITVSKNDPIFNLPITLINTISVVQEVASRTNATDAPPGDLVPSSREELFSDVLKLQSGLLFCLEEKTLFTNFVFSDIATLEVNNNLSFKFVRFLDTYELMTEFVWNKFVGYWQKIPIINRGYRCKFQDIRNQYCPYCDSIYHRITNTNHLYNVFRSSDENLVNFGLEVSVQLFDGSNSFYYTNENDNYLGNSHLSISFNSSTNYTININNNFIFVPSSNPTDSSYFIWSDSISNGCNGINITYQDFYEQSSCQSPQYSCSNIHYFRDTHSKTQSINNNLNYLFGDSRSGISYISNNTLSIERLQPSLDLALSIYLPGLPFLQPLIKQATFTVDQDDTSSISINYSFLNYGSMAGDYSISISCNDTTNNLVKNGIVEKNATKEFTLTFPKSIVKVTKYYECKSKVSVGNQEYWSKEGKEIDSSIYFKVVPNQVDQKCDLQFDENSMQVTRNEYLQNDKVLFLFQIKNNIESIDWFKLRVDCLGDSNQNKSYSEAVQISHSLAKQISVSMNSNKNDPQCSISIQSYQTECNYNILDNSKWNYKNVYTNSPGGASSSTKITISTTLLVLSVISFLFI